MQSGLQVVDFFVRECRAVVQGDMIIVRLGSVSGEGKILPTSKAAYTNYLSFKCGSLSDKAPIGSVVVPYHSFGVTRNYDHFFREDKAEEARPYHITRAVSLRYISISLVSLS